MNSSLLADNIFTCASTSTPPAASVLIALFEKSDVFASLFAESGITKAVGQKYFFSYFVCFLALYAFFFLVGVAFIYSVLKLCSWINARLYGDNNDNHASSDFLSNPSLFFELACLNSALSCCVFYYFYQPSVVHSCLSHGVFFYELFKPSQIAYPIVHLVSTVVSVRIGLYFCNFFCVLLACFLAWACVDMILLSYDFPMLQVSAKTGITSATSIVVAELDAVSSSCECSSVEHEDECVQEEQEEEEEPVIFISPSYPVAETEIPPSFGFNYTHEDTVLVDAKELAERLKTTLRSKDQVYYQPPPSSNGQQQQPLNLRNRDRM